MDLIDMPGKCHIVISFLLVGPSCSQLISSWSWNTGRKLESLTKMNCMRYVLTGTSPLCYDLSCHCLALCLCVWLILNICFDVCRWRWWTTSCSPSIPSRANWSPGSVGWSASPTDTPWPALIDCPSSWNWPGAGKFW